MAELSVRRVTRWHGVTVLLGEPYPISERRGGRAPLPVFAVNLTWGDHGQLIEQYAPGGSREGAGHG